MMAFSPCTTPIYLRRRKSEVREVAGKSLFLVRPCSTKSAVVRFGPRDDVLNIGQSPAGKVAAGVRWRHDLGQVFHHFDSAKGREHTSPLTHTVPVEFSSKTSKEIPGVGYIVGKISRTNRLLYIISSYAIHSIPIGPPNTPSSRRLAALPSPFSPEGGNAAGTLPKVLNVHIAPVVFQILSHKSTMTMMGLVFAAQKAAIIHHVLADRLLDPPFVHQLHEQGFVGFPTNPPLPVVGQHIFRRCKLRHVHVLHPTDFAQKVREIIPFGETGKLGGVVEAYVYDPPRVGCLKELKETASGLLREPDGEYPHDFRPASYRDDVPVTLLLLYAIRSACFAIANSIRSATVANNSPCCPSP